MTYEIEKLIGDYSILSDKHGLPSFEEVNKYFEIDAIDKEVQYLLREIRKTMVEKVANSLAFLEMVMNPANAPRMYLLSVKSLTSENMKDIELLYDAFSKIILDSLNRQIEGYNEDEEALLIRKVYDVWDKNKTKFSKILETMKNPNSENSVKEKGYFG